jgi:hypothetical protein
MTDLNWRPPGPISAQFLASRAEMAIINGPVGSGKTTTNFFFHLGKAQQQRPSRGRLIRLRGERADRPLRRYWLTVLRDDYRQLWRSTIPSWQQHFPAEEGWSGAVNAPARHRIIFPMDDGTAVEFTAEFVALGDNDIEEFMRGYQPTSFFLNEIDTLHPDVRKHAGFRVGRFPPRSEVELDWYGITGDCNAPIIDGEFYNSVFIGRPAGTELYRLPGGLDPGAENLQNLPEGYYERQIRSIADPYLVRRMVHNQPSPSRSGKPVHDDFNDFLHVAPADIAPVAGLPLMVGYDAGLDPAAAIGQKLGNGRWNIIDELVSPHGTGAVHFARLVNEFLLERYPQWHSIPLLPQLGIHLADPAMHLRPGNIRAWCDPAATYGGDTNSAAEADRTWCELVAYHTGIRISPAPTNNTTERRAGLQRVLTLMPDGKPAFALSPRCKMIRAGLAGQFRYRRMQIAREERYADEVDKNVHSHVCEALEYLMLGGGEGAEVHERRQRGWDTRSLPRQAQDDWRLG